MGNNLGNIKIEDLGYNSFFESNRNQLSLSSFSVARVIAEHRGAYRVKNENGEHLARITGKQMFNAASREDYPAVGDWVAITELDSSQAIIESVLPRLTTIKRKHGDKTQVIATNIDTAFVVESVDRDYNLNRFERYFAITENDGVRSAIILNKTDLLSQDELAEKLSELKNRFPGIDVIFSSTINDEGLDELKKYIVKGKTYCFLGSSGVGKSSLINKLIGENLIKTGGTSSHSGRGKHVTTGRHMYFLDNGGIVIDNPGMREVGVSDVNENVASVFDEITVLSKKCKYRDCTHTHEPGCEVLSAVSFNKLDKDKYSNYLKLKKETEFNELTEREKREKNRRFGKFIKTTKDELKRYGHKGNI